MSTIYEINMSNAQADVNTGRVKQNSKIVEVFSALSAGKRPEVDDKTLDKSVATIKELSSKAIDGDNAARSEINSIIRFSIESKLLEVVRLFDFMGTYRRIGYNEAPMMKTYGYESIDSRFQASSSDVPFAAVNWREYPIGTQTISAGFAVDYRELQNGNFDGNIREGMNQVQIDMQNKMTYYVMTVLYNALKNAKGVKHFAEDNGITKTAVDNMLKSMRRYKDKKLFSQYSLGMKQRLAIALAVMHDPELLILDEPINGLDPIGIAEVRSFIRELCDARGKTILISSHILSEISLLADDIGIIDHGALLEEESLAELEQKSSKHIRFTLSDTAQAARILERNFHENHFSIQDDHNLRLHNLDLPVGKIVTAFVENGLEVSEAHTCEESLEDYFKRVTGGEGIA